MIAVSVINTKSAVQIKPCPNYHLSLGSHWQKSIFLIDDKAGLGYILPISRKTNLCKFILYF